MESNGSGNIMRIAITIFIAALLALFINSAIWFSLEENKEASRGDFLLLKGQFADAESQLELALAKHPSDNKLRSSLGEAQLREGKQAAALATFDVIFQIEPHSQYATRVCELLGLFTREVLNEKYVDAMVLVSPNEKGAFVVRGIPVTSPPLFGDDPETAKETRIDPEKIELAYISSDGKQEKTLAMFSDFPSIVTRMPVWAPDGSGLGLVGSPKATPDAPPKPFGIYWLPVEGDAKGPVSIYTPNDPSNDIFINNLASAAGGKKFAFLARIEAKPQPITTVPATTTTKPVPATTPSRANINEPVKSQPAPTPPPTTPTSPSMAPTPPTPPPAPRYEIWVVEPGKAPVSVLKLGNHQELAQLTWVGDKLLTLITETKDGNRTLLAEIDVAGHKTEHIGLKDAVYSSFTASPDGSKLAVLCADYDKNGDGVINDKDRHHLAIFTLATNKQYDLDEFTPDFDPLVLLQWSSNNRLLAYANCWGGERLLVFSLEGKFLFSPASTATTEGLTGIRLVDGGKRAMLLDTTKDWNGDGKLTAMDGRVTVIELDKSADPLYVSAMVRRLMDTATSTKSNR